MKIKVLSRSNKDFVREGKQDVHKIHRNLDPAAHPFERAREYVRALNATKLDKVFAKPFVGALGGHADSVWSMATVPTRLTTLLTGACDGELRCWNLSSQQVRWRVRAHTGFVRGVVVPRAREGRVLTCGDDRVVKLWSMDGRAGAGGFEAEGGQAEAARRDGSDVNAVEGAFAPIQRYVGESGFLGLDCRWNDDTFATSGMQIDVWDPNRSEPLHSFSWGVDTINWVKFNRIQTNVLAGCATDRNIVLYDLKSRTPIRKLNMKTTTNCLCWNPMEAFNFTIACQDTNLYTFDMRKLDKALTVHDDHVNAVMSVDYAPTGREFVSGGYDRSVRIYRVGDGHSREIYHTKRMQRVFCVNFSADNNFVLSGSDDTNVRIWKSQAAKPLKTLLPREKEKLKYSEKLKKKFRHMPEIRRIARHRHLPRFLHCAKKSRAIQHESARRKDARRRAHSKPGAIPFVSERKKSVRKEVE
eukprot:272511_1